jgi:hypothetical protein
MRLRSICNAIA